MVVVNGPISHAMLAEKYICPILPVININIRDIVELHYDDFIMGAMASEITSLTIVYSTVYSDADQRKHKKAQRHWPLCGEFTGDRWNSHTNGQ